MRIAAIGLLAVGLWMTPHSRSAASEAAAPSAASERSYLDLRRQPRVHGDPVAGKAKSELCASCHGANGTAIAPIFPNLAGQSVDHLYWELVSFKRGGRPDSPMTALVSGLAEPDMRDLAAYFSSLPPSAGSAANVDDTRLLTKGEQVFMHGNAARGVPACQGCHGVDARGSKTWGAYPALRSQQTAYLQTRLTEYRDGKPHDSTHDFIMTGVTQNLDDDSIQALAAWLSSLPP